MNQKLLSDLVSIWNRNPQVLVIRKAVCAFSDIKTTEIYARADSELKRKALENAYLDLLDTDLPDWNENTDLMNWLQNCDSNRRLCKVMFH